MSNVAAKRATKPSQPRDTIPAPPSAAADVAALHASFGKLTLCGALALALGK